MTRIGVRTTVETPKGLIGPTFVGKRVNFIGELGTVKDHSDRLCLISFDRWNIDSITMQKVIAALPNLVSRDSFNYRPGDREEQSDRS